MTGDSEIARQISQLPKAELHVHLEGTVDAEGLRSLQAGESPAPFRRGRFDHFLDHFRAILDLLRGPQDYGLLTGRYLDAATRHGIRHVEFYVSLGAAARRGHSPGEVMAAIARQADQRREQVTALVLVDSVRQFGPDEAARTLDAALEGREHGPVVGFGMGGDETAIGAAPFRAVFERARKAGLRTTVHAGESGGPDSVRECLDELGPDRIAHGIAAAQDRALLHRLARDGVPLDVCPGSNLATGVVASLEEHPLPALLDAGVRVTLGSDDPGIFDTDLTREYLLARRIAGLDLEGLARLAQASLEASFSPPETSED